MRPTSLTYIHKSVEIQHDFTGRVIWLYGLSGAGKSTIAEEMKETVVKAGLSCFILDGDDLRSGLNSNLGFSANDREENIRRAAETALLLSQTTDIVICTFITPFESTRKNTRIIMKNIKYDEIFINTPFSECEKRDVKGLYKKARMGKIKNFTGISSPFELPKYFNYSINTKYKNVDECSHDILTRLDIVKKAMD